MSAGSNAQSNDEIRCVRWFQTTVMAAARIPHRNDRTIKVILYEKMKITSVHTKCIYMSCCMYGVYEVAPLLGSCTLRFYRVRAIHASKACSVRSKNRLSTTTLQTQMKITRHRDAKNHQQHQLDNEIVSCAFQRERRKKYKSTTE